MSTTPEHRQSAQFKVARDVERIDSFFYTYPDRPDVPVIAGVRLGGNSEITVYTPAQAQAIANAFLGLVAQFAAHEAQARDSGECLVAYPPQPGFLCTLDSGHVGDHLARGARQRDEPQLTWPQAKSGAQPA